MALVSQEIPVSQISAFYYPYLQVRSAPQICTHCCENPELEYTYRVGVAGRTPAQ